MNVRDANNCLGTFTFDVIDPPAIETMLDAMDVSCAGLQDGIVGVTASGGRPDYTYLWSTDATTQKLTTLPRGLHRYHYRCQRLFRSSGYLHH